MLQDCTIAIQPMLLLRDLHALVGSQISMLLLGIISPCSCIEAGGSADCPSSWFKDVCIPLPYEAPCFCFDLLRSPSMFLQRGFPCHYLTTFHALALLRYQEGYVHAFASEGLLDLCHRHTMHLLRSCRVSARHPCSCFEGDIVGPDNCQPGIDVLPRVANIRSPSMLLLQDSLGLCHRQVHALASKGDASALEA